MTNGKNPAIKTMEATVVHSMVDSASRQPQPEELPIRHYPMLPLRDRSDRPVHVVEVIHV
jgi:hypothetical protein